MEVQFTCPYWGQEGTRASTFLASVLEQEYDGVEINLPESGEFVSEFMKALDAVRSSKPAFPFIAQQVMSPASESVEEYISRMKTRLEFLASLKPDFINSHTGKDYFTFDDNCKAIDTAENIAQRTGVRILHETHRGRFTFHASSLLPYLEKFPDLELTGDFSHWCTVSESMLGDQVATLEKIIPHVQHIHARIGFEHGPQVNDPFAPEWSDHRKIYLKWWKQIMELQNSKGKASITITPEAGPVPYMPTQPYSREPLSDQRNVNYKMKAWLSSVLA